MITELFLGVREREKQILRKEDRYRKPLTGQPNHLLEAENERKHQFPEEEKKERSRVRMTIDYRGN